MAKSKISLDVTAAARSGWVRWLPNALPGAGYIRLENSGGKDIKVSKITSPDYKRVTIYRTVTDTESSKMVKLDGVTLPAKGEFSFVPGAHHLMLEKPTRLITPGDNARVIFFLDNGTVFKTRLPVRTSPDLY
ncbi:copper chaperone PCu(A)C [Streptomyces liangshanensis]|uniref:Copper chaperone PCu(A)C n=1 Tax=Streptomyces liangshanensis TaxID=2717324 RepID=A0A6G9GZQ6_9ACTN|nr:copper chaperone PCu(A)C [Streptomyces liangshanensis]QIQ03700.1 copper chaperone PCu(A)C [Streptomyces liangshanensis]